MGSPALGVQWAAQWLREQPVGKARPASSPFSLMSARLVASSRSQISIIVSPAPSPPHSVVHWAETRGGVVLVRTGFDEGLDVLARLSVHLGAAAELPVRLLEGGIQGLLLRAARPVHRRPPALLPPSSLRCAAVS